MKLLYKLLFTVLTISTLQTDIKAGQCAFSVDCENDDASCINGICTRKPFCRGGSCPGSTNSSADSLNLEDPF